MKEPQSPDDKTHLEITTSGVSSSRDEAAAPDLNQELSQPPLRLGRYEVMHTLGSGGFGRVVLARDSQLDRLVAIKIPNPKRFRSAKAVESLLSEAKMAARLRHDGIVTVFDVGHEGDVPFIVLEYIRGRTLSDFLKKESWSHHVAARMVMEIASALHHAHSEGFIHRDLKPLNILLDNEDRPRISDFGLAVHHRDVAKHSKQVVGTPMYMAPEQATGENHRIDQRTDIWAMGVIFYQMLCRKRPFSGDDDHDLISSIVRAEFTPPRQIDSTIPSELERICMRCLARRMSQRYRRADQLALDLSLWFESGEHHTESATGSGTELGSGYRGIAGKAPTAVVPRGLRPYKREDSVFFPRLLPGPRDRNGLPITLSFWISTLEQRDSDATIKVGLLYGPSGCGKSSFVRAGLLPFLDPTITTLYVDATGPDLDGLIARNLQAKFPSLADLQTLPEMLAELRESFSDSDQTEHDRPKIIVFIDQFEQWLAKDGASLEHPLVQGLRQCDGGCVQCMLIVRDDFWLPISRLMSLLEVSIVDGENAMLIDSFDEAHAKDVLCELGRSMSCLPVAESEMTDSQHRFLDRAIKELGLDGRLFPVRLVIFAELVRKQPWNAATLDRLGGAEGVGVSYLDHAVGRDSTAARQVHSEAARNVLSELLPIHGDIKKSSVRRDRLLEVSGYAQSPRDFDSLIKLLNGELRLLTPVLPNESGDPFDSRDSQSGVHQVAAYRLTHDFLVPSIRQWLERDLRGQRGGRQQLMLQEQAAMWADRKSARYLPSVTEYLLIRFYTRSRQWTREQTEMMQAAGQRIGRQVMAVLSVCVFLGLVVALVLRTRHRRGQVIEAQRLYGMIQKVKVDDVPAILDQLQPLSDHSFEPAFETFRDEQQSVQIRLRAGLACLRTDPRPLQQIVVWLTDEQVRPRDVAVVSGELQLYRDSAVALLQARLGDDRLDPDSRLRLAAVLSQLAGENPKLTSMRGELVDTLVQHSYSDGEIWLRLLQPIGNSLLAPLQQEYTEDLDLQSARIVVAAMRQYDESPQEGVPRLIAGAKGPQFRAVMENWLDDAMALQTWIKAYDQLPGDEVERDVARANLAIASLLMNDPTMFRDLTLDRNAPQRTRLVAMLNPERIDLWQLIELAEIHQGDPDLLAAFVIAADAFTEHPCSHQQRERLGSLLTAAAQRLDDPELHVAADLILRRWQFSPPEMGDEVVLQGQTHASMDRQWFVNSSGQKMVVLEMNGSSPETRYRVAIGAIEVSIGLLRTFEREVNGRFQVRGSDQMPANSLLVKNVAAFCNWLSQRDEISTDQWCYEPGETLKSASDTPRSDFLERSGYRLPTKAEWMTAAGGSHAHWISSCDPRVADRYLWERDSAHMMVHSVGTRLPNPQGLIDLYGNVSELAHDDNASRNADVERALWALGGNALTPLGLIQTDAIEKRMNSRIVDAYVGFRVARTLPPE